MSVYKLMNAVEKSKQKIFALRGEKEAGIYKDTWKNENWKMLEKTHTY